MGTVELLKRAIPFFATAAFGLFIASFFVDIDPGFKHHERGRWHHDMWELRMENEQLREENRQLKEGNGRPREKHDPMHEYMVNPPSNLEFEEMNIPTVEAPAPPPAVRLHKLHAR